jgi:hypothetical protein
MVMQRPGIDDCQDNKFSYMNHFRFMAFVFLLGMVSCSRTAYKITQAPLGTLLGKWAYTEHYVSTGGPGQWSLVQPAGQIIEFKEDGTFQSAPSFSGTFRRFEIIDSTKLRFSPAPTPSGFVIMEYKVDTAEGTLLLRPIEPMCIEGCDHKFKRSRLQ